MTWNTIKNSLTGKPNELIEVYFMDMTDESWRKLFSWAQDKINVLDCQHGRLKNSEFSLPAFLNGDMSYMADIMVTENDGLILAIIERDELTIDIEKCDIDTEESFNNFLKTINHIATVIDCTNYIVCPEFKKDKAFIVNGAINHQ